MTDDRQRWLRRFRPREDAEVVLLCFPHAGGAASVFYGLAAEAPPSIEVQAVQYPGRHERRREPCAASIAELARGAVAAVAGESRPIALFGHSMGALVAFEAARQLAGADVRGLFVSARAAPSLRRGDKALDEWTDEAVVAELKRLGGTGSAQLGSEEILRMMLPALRGDYRALRGYDPGPDAIVHCPITGLTGDADVTTPVADVEAWRRHTDAEFSVRVFPGGHFYLADQQAEVLATIADRLARSGSPTPR